MFSTFPVPFNPSNGNRVYIRKKKGIAVKSRCRDGPAAAAAAIFMFYCIAKYTWLGSAMAVKSLYLAGGVGRESKAISIFVGPVGGTGSF